ncbi:hypothetical protein ESCO_004014 [Escovopsis weberi]|uniref:Integral membrane protein n=1 Tax=Escovopsis weberi TaxID=150374 RepID=A0A0N0RUA9_ESCWE|nr:hypothetical protein ESCO_004014 [Escovopsis weberi]
MRAAGLPNEVAAYCPEWRAVDYSLYWYRLPEVPKFFICSNCHGEHIKDTPLASRFQRIRRADHELTSCWFWTPRVREILWPQALRSGSLDSLREFMGRRVELKACKSAGFVAASEGFKWFNMVNNEINGFVSCEACYEDRIAGGLFEHKFQPDQRQGKDEQWSCDVWVPFISRSIVKKAKQNNWAEFVALATRRFQLPACAGKQVQSNSGTWYRTRHRIENLEVCETCYMDKLLLTRFEHHFERVSQSNDLDSFIHAFTTRFTCKLTPLNLPMAFALQNASERRDWTVFQNAATAICRLAPCTLDGIVWGNWWTLKGGCANYDVCEVCYVGILQTGGLERFFEVARRSSAEVFVCNFCAGTPRFKQYVDRFAQTLDTGVFSCYSDFVRTFASIPVCPGKQTREKSTWWGYREGLFCQDCYVTFVSKSALGRAVPLKAAYDERPQICQIWSPRMRTMWMGVCDAGVPGSPESDKALGEFKAFMEKRLQIYVQTVPQMDMILAMKKMKMQTAMTQGLVSTMYHGMDGLLQASNATDGYLHGNSQIGWHATSQGAQGAQAFNNMQAGFMNANRADEWMQMAQLEMIWKQVE